MYKFNIGDEVRHFDVPNSVGIITEHLSFDEDTGEPLYELNPEEPWYHIEWKSGDLVKEGEWIGFEYEGSLILIE